MNSHPSKRLRLLSALCLMASVLKPEASQARGGGHAPSADAPINIEAGRTQRAARRSKRCSKDPRVVLGQVSIETCIGADLFFRETFGGNGRTCSSCHPASNNYTLDPDYIAGLPDSDALFVAEHDPELAKLEKPDLLREAALVLVNADGFQDPTQKFVLRSVQHILGLAVSTAVPPFSVNSPVHALDGTLLPFPAERLGWSGDGAPGEGRLSDFADGAIRQHATRSLNRQLGVDFFLPDGREREAIATFSRSVGRLNDLELADVTLSDAGAARGQEVFTNGQGRECAFRCHTNAGAIADTFDTIFPDAVFLGTGNVTLDIGTPLVRLPAVNAAGVMLDGGFGVDPLDSDGDDVVDSFGNGGFNVPPLIEAADTGPMFHSNAFETLEDAIRFYSTEDFGFSLVGSNGFTNRRRLQPMPLSEDDILEMGRFLRVLNTALNLQMALYRLDSALAIAAKFGGSEWDVERGLLELSLAELQDALDVLSAVEHLHDGEQDALRHALCQIQATLARPSSTRQRGRRLRQVRDDIARANAALGVGLEMQMGEGTLMF